MRLKSVVRWVLPSTVLLSAILTGTSPATLLAGDSSDQQEEIIAASPVETDDAAILEYWTEERRDAATAVSFSIPEISREQARQLSSDVPEEPATSLSQPVSATGGVASARTLSTAESTDDEWSMTNGKLFFRSNNPADGQDHKCSAAAVNSGSKNLVITAGHCVYNEEFGYNKYFAFVPGYGGDSITHTYPGYQALTTQTWVDHGNSTDGLEGDVAFIVVGDNPMGGNLIETVGGHGLNIGGPHEYDVTLFGYPSVVDGGETQISCSGTTYKYWIGLLHQFPALDNCVNGPGGSGGPWIEDYSSSSGLGYVRSVSSFMIEDTTDRVASAYLGTALSDLFSAAKTVGETIN